jgi:cytochrome bd ubiquinol oxidase subunit I
MRTADAVNPAPGLYWGLVVLLIVYTVLTVVTLVVLQKIKRANVQTPAAETSGASM